MTRNCFINCQRSSASTFAIIMALTAGLAMPANSETLSEAVIEAVRTNPEVGIVGADRKAVQQELRQARALYLPSVDLTARAGLGLTDSPSTRASGDDGDLLGSIQTGLTLTQLLFDGYSTDSEIERQLGRLDSASYRVAEAAEFVALDAVEAYLDILRQSSVLALAEQNVGNHNRILSSVRSLQRSGRGGIADVRQAEARLAAAEESLATVAGALDDARATYRRVVGTEPGELVAPITPKGLLPADAEAAANLALTESPTVKIFRSDVNTARAELKGSRSGFYPSVNLEVGANASDGLNGVSGSNVDATAQVVLRYNLSRGGGDIAREREAFARLGESRFTLERARRQATETARLSFNAMNTANARVAALESQAAANVRTRDAYLEEFKLGQRSLLDLLDSENELFVSRSSLATAQQASSFAAYRVLATTGQLLAALEVDAPAEAVNIYRDAQEYDNVDVDPRISEAAGQASASPYAEEVIEYDPVEAPLLIENIEPSAGPALIEEDVTIAPAAEPRLQTPATGNPLNGVFESLGDQSSIDRPEAFEGATTASGTTEHEGEYLLDTLSRWFGGSDKN